MLGLKQGSGNVQQNQFTVFEKSDRIGGLLRYGIPNFKMEKHLIDRRLEQMRAEGVKFQPNATVGGNVPLEDLRRDWTRHDPFSIAAALEGVPPTAPLEGGLTSDMIRCPVLVIPGNDVIHPTEAGIAVAYLIPGAVAAPPFDSLPRADEVRGLVAVVHDFLAHAAIA